MTLPSWTRPVLRPVCLASSMLFWRMIRKTRLWLTAGSPALALPVGQSRDPAIAVGRTLLTRRRTSCTKVSSSGLRWPARLRRTMHLVMEMRTGHPDCLGNGLHREPSLGCDKSRKLGFFELPPGREPPSGSPLPSSCGREAVRGRERAPRAVALPNSRPQARPSHRCRSAFRQQMTPTIEQIWRDATSSGNRRNRLAREKTLLDDLQLLLGRPASAACLAGDQFDPSIVVSHKPVLEDSLKPPALCQLSGRNGGHFITREQVHQIGNEP